MPFCLKCGAELPEGAEYCCKCGTPAGSPVARSERRTLHIEKRRPVSNLTIGLIVLVVAVVIAGLLSSVLLLGLWHPFGEVVGSGDLVT
ncbi:MAG: hypothetical protein O2V44_06890 [Candidatus Bathyarchaeota archaeon]|nr:hypothetical protein [Candidatus Bathyarchaeota archaeon]